jgi:hypothetical protein
MALGTISPMPFEISDEFPLISEHLGIRDYSRVSCQNTDMHLPAGLATSVTEFEPVSAEDLPQRTGYPPVEARLRPQRCTAPFSSLREFDRGGKLSIFRVLASSCQNSPHAVNRSLR